MTGKERVIRTIRRQKTDRTPIYAWVQNIEMTAKVAAKYGHVDRFYDKYEVDMYHLFPVYKPFDTGGANHQKIFYEDELPEIKFTDPDEPMPYPPEPRFRNPDDMPYNDVRELIDHHSGNRGRFVYAQTPGCFEFNPWGNEHQLEYLVLHTGRIRELYQRFTAWTLKYVNNLMDMGVDAIHVSDDWGAQKNMMISMDLWRDLVYPYHKAISDAVKKRGVFLSLHSDGNVTNALDGICEIGYDIVHPFQESAGMDYGLYLKKYRDKFTLLGGLDVQSTLGFGDYENVEREIRRVYGLFKDGGLIFCTSHSVQPHCSVEELEFAYDLVYNLVRGRA